MTEGPHPLLVQLEARRRSVGMRADARPSNGHSERAADVPRARFYVAMTDRWFSGWGPAEGLTNRHFVLCESMAEAEVVELEARRRVEMLRVHVNVGRPRQRAGTLYSWSGPDGWLRRAARSDELCG